jgi:predicted protein tyrosine phosphatase
LLKLLVVCSHNKWRSPTAEAIYRHDRRFSIRSAGLGQLSPHVLSQTDLLWADLLLYMEKEHLERIKKIFPNITLPKSINLDILDEYPYMDPKLIEILQDKIEEILRIYMNPHPN